MARLARRNYRQGHYYTLDGERVIGVTTAIDGGIPKPALQAWAAEQTAMAAVQRREEWQDLSEYEAVKLLTKARFADRKRALAKGGAIHSLAERLIAGETIDVTDADEGHIDAYIAFLKDWNVKVLWSEVPVACTTTQVPYAGTLDLVVVIGGLVWLLDLKTGKGVYNEVALQLAAYRYCDLAKPANSDEVPMMPVDRTGVVHLRADGYDLYPVTAGKPEWHAFLHALQVARFCEREDLVGEPIYPEGDAA